MTYKFSPTESPEESLNRVVLEEIDLAISESTDGTLDPHQVIHQVRKRCKRIRGALRLFRGSLATYAEENSQFRDAARRLGGIRDAEAVVEACNRVLQGELNERLALGLTAVREALLDRRDQLASEQGSLTERLRDFAMEMRAARVRVENWSLRKPGWGAIEEGFRRSYRSGREAAQLVREGGSSEQFHEWRKVVKHHSYHVRLLGEMWEPEMQGRYEQLTELEGLLGDEHDLAMLETLLPQLEVPRPVSQECARLVHAHRERLQSRACSHGQKIYGMEAEEITRRVGSRWQEWHTVGAPEIWPN